ncbi:MAG: 5'-methylthioadenosine/adenosylhomocysteine nucleosidase [Clostridiales bacterium]|nr:5'-methylthioadenosine/adenosylhomocysteine nucleosidase [Clostridiales bacterium]
MDSIGIIGAMDEEVKELQKLMKNTRVRTIATMDFYEGSINDKNVVVVRSGIGKVNAAICTQILIDNFNVRCIINTGIAGSLDAKINIGDIVLSSDTIQHDVDVSAFGHELGKIPRMESSIFVADSDMVSKGKDICQKVNPDTNVYVGRILSGDQFIQDKEKKDWLVSNFKGMCVEMEGASIAHVAALNNIPFLIIRAISDKADGSAQMDYYQFETLAIERTVKLLVELIPSL